MLMVVQTLLLHTLLVLFEMISGIGELLFVREAVEGRYPTILSSTSFLDCRDAPWKRLKNKTLHLSARCVGVWVTHEC